ncbi:MAG: Fe-S cluster assembly protein SufB [Candidatus Parvarchaeota archaeon]|nr:Fe-S cluster assembly protein SufB [Candidatus Parvarchaeota archaeon]
MERIEFDAGRYNFREDVDYKIKFPKGLSESVIRRISEIKGEPNWMKEFRLNAYRFFLKRPMPNWIDGIDSLNLDEISYFASASDSKSSSWEDVPKGIKDTYEKLGIPEAERRALGGVEAMFDSTVIYNNVREELKREGIIFCDTDSAVKDYPELVKNYFGKVVSPNDNKFAALNSALWSGGSFIYVPKGVKVKLPLQAYFRINAANMGQFERTLIIADEGSDVTYIEGCSATIYSKESLHAAVVEIIAKKGAHVKYITIQNWSSDVYNLVTKRAFAYEDAYVEWIDANIGAKLTAKYPSVYMLEPGSKANILSIAFADRGQHQDAGAKAIHLAPDTSSVIRSKSICLNGGRTTYRGLVKIPRGSKGSSTSVTCDALIFDDASRTDTYPYMEISEDSADVSHEASVGKIGEEQKLYMESRGIPENEGVNMIVLGFVGEFIKELPLEFALEFNRLIKINMENAVG